MKRFDWILAVSIGLSVWLAFFAIVGATACLAPRGNFHPERLPFCEEDWMQVDQFEVPRSHWLDDPYQTQAAIRINRQEIETAKKFFQTPGQRDPFRRLVGKKI